MNSKRTIVREIRKRIALAAIERRSINVKESKEVKNENTDNGAQMRL